MAQKGYFIQYKFIIPESMKHSSYTYQKLFRALYGYSQTVSKSNGKTYHYHRPGVLSSSPFVRPGKNCVVIPKEIFQNLIGFFKTGKNPGHYWHVKGDWKAVYYMDEKDLDDKAVVGALEELLDRTYILSVSRDTERLASELETFVGLDMPKNEKQAYLNALLNKAQEIVSLPWFKSTYQRSDALKNFYSCYKQLRNP